VTKSIWEAYFHDPRYAPSPIQAELVAGGRIGRKSGRGFYEHAADARKPLPATEGACGRPSNVTTVGAGPLVDGLHERIAAAGIGVERKSASGPAHFVVDGMILAPSDGRPASAIAGNVVVYDLAFDYRTCTRLAVARSAGCSDAAYGTAVGALQAAGIAVSEIGDAAGLVVMRTVAMLANEAADAVSQDVASARDVDLAMRNGLNYPIGPLAWADAIGLGHVRAVLANLSAHYGDPRYRTSPLLRRSRPLVE